MKKRQKILLLLLLYPFSVSIMKKKVTGLFIFLLFIGFAKGYGQDDEVIMDCLMRLDCQIHEDFMLCRQMDCFDSIPKLKYALTCQLNKFDSKDGHVKVFIEVFKPMTRVNINTLLLIICISTIEAI